MDTSTKRPNRGRTLADFPELAAQLHPTKNGDLVAEEINAGSHLKVWWQCRAGEKHEWQSLVKDRVKGRRCPFCSGRRVLAGWNDMQTMRPDLAQLIHPRMNERGIAGRVFPNTHYKIWWQCLVKDNHVWESTGFNLASGNWCPYCAGRKVSVGDNDMATTHPEIATEFHALRNYPVTAQAVVAGTNRTLWWLCSVGHEWRAAGDNRVNGTGCPYCAGKKAWPGYNDLATTHPELATEFHPTKNGKLTVNNVIAGSNKQIWWRCIAGHEWRAPGSSRTNMKSGCPACAEYGFNTSKPGYLYLLFNGSAGLLKIGISNAPARRLSRHSHNGFTPLDVQGPYSDGARVRNWETEIKGFLRAYERANGDMFADTIGLARFDGYTESWLRSSFPVGSLAELKRLVEEGEAA